jgi:phenylacetate-CoA ligase
VEAQIVQETPERIEVLVVPGERFDAASSERLVRSLQERVGPAMAIDVRLVQSIPRTKNGKFRSVVSKLPRAGGER